MVHRKDLLMCSVQLCLLLTVTLLALITIFATAGSIDPSGSGTSNGSGAIVGSVIATNRTSCRKYKIVNGSLCINKEFTVSYLGVSDEGVCAALCSERENCRAFSTASAFCQLFVFDRCSKSVRNCNCSDHGRLFVKQQPGLEPGVLCPTGYGHNLCGVKYKMYLGTGFWWPSRWKCDNESGLVIMADVTSLAEMTHLDTQITASYNMSYWLGGYQLVNSTEPAGGWFWVACNATLDSSLWGKKQPDDSQNRENVVGGYSLVTKLNDFSEGSGTPKGVLCECVSPFD